MFNTTSELLKYNNTNEHDEMIDIMAETLFNAMTTCAGDNRDGDAIACYQEWVVDGIDPQDGDVEIYFMQDLTAEGIEN
jgi:hypothetical protein